jgi:precorrin-6Y C5,15-methyltransferase (decarboxylating)
VNPITVIGVPVEGLGALSPEDQELIASASVIAGGTRHLAALGRVADEATTIEINRDLSAALDRIERAAEAGQVVVLASGDPGFFGVGRVLAERFGPDGLDVRPAASSIAVAFGRLGIPWDDAVVASAHGRPIEAAVAAVIGARKAAVLASPDATPEVLGRALIEAGAVFDRAVVVTSLGTASESVETGDLAWLASGDFSPLSIVVLLHGSEVAGEAVTSWPPPAVGGARRFGRHEDDFDHRAGMITKAEVRVVVLAHLELPPVGVLWDLGAGSGSVAIEASLLQPGMRVIAVERDPEECERIAANADRLGARVEVVTAEAAECVATLPRPDRVFVGGGGLEVLDAALACLLSEGRVVATYAAVGRAAAGAERLGNLVQVAVSRGKSLPDGTMRLVAADPVFVCWGPGSRSAAGASESPSAAGAAESPGEGEP